MSAKLTCELRFDFRLHTFEDDLLAEPQSELERRLQHHPSPLAARRGGDEAAIDLELRAGWLHQELHGGRAGSIVVDRDLEALKRKSNEHFGGLGKIVDEAGFGTNPN